MRPAYGEGHAAIRQSIQENATFSSSQVTMNALSAVIASYGLLLDNSAVVIGAMIVALLLGPLMGVALALVDADNKLLAKALLATTGGTAIVLIVSVIIGSIHQDIPLGCAAMCRTEPNIMDLLIALAGGAAGAYATLSPRISASLVGVAVSTSLVPPLSASGILLARGDIQHAQGAFLLFFANMVAVQVSSSVVLWLHGYHKITGPMRNSPRVFLFLNGPSLILLIALIIILVVNFQKSLTSRRFEIDVRNTLVKQLQSHRGSYLAELRIDQEKCRTVVTAVVRTPFSIEPSQIANMQSKLPPASPPVELHIRSIITKEATSSGWLHESRMPIEVNRKAPCD
ncbi:TIGR00341 family protein [bacterium]|nr:TIGR00341 family protein [bacterium]